MLFLHVLHVVFQVGDELHNVAAFASLSLCCMQRALHAVQKSGFDRSTGRLYDWCAWHLATLLVTNLHNCDTGLRIAGKLQAIV